MSKDIWKLTKLFHNRSIKVNKEILVIVLDGKDNIGIKKNYITKSISIIFIRMIDN